MKRKLLSIIAAFTMMFSFALAAAPAFAAPVDVFPDAACNGNTNVCGNKGSTNPIFKIIKNVINVLLFASGIIAIIMIIIGGINYTLSSGDNAKVASAKNTVLYAVVGLVVASLSFVVVNFIVARIF